MDGNSVSVERVIEAAAPEIFALLADTGRHAEFDGSGTVGGERSRSRLLTLGSSFTMAMRGRRETLFVPYRTTSTVIEFVQDRLIAWQTYGPARLIGGRIWRYELMPNENGTLVRETWDIAQEKFRSVVIGKSLPRQTEEGMRVTLDRIATRLSP
ncbi:SRPBCC family protein [Nocardia bovistercoris]|uniref:Dimethyladenosine transferase n=1 Tax=Nocardia bovistercoris TaxID=2785916 RepID=A0A931I7D5_9NOCA|nr:dimethyladenosine transferase [Nocardia bovistercoris]MBH0774775.1 dimethyladenosine transferase [Nocardia bovistercoris]